MGRNPTDCMRQPLPQYATAGVWTSAIVLLAAALLWPSVGVASTGTFLFPADDGSCYDVEPLKQHSTMGADLTRAAEPTPEEPPCTIADDADPSSNICLEAANSPISTLPRLLAEATGKETAEGVVDSILARIDENGIDDHQVVVAVTSTPDPAPVSDGSTVACSTHSEECRSLPPVPPTLQLDASGPAARNIFSSSDLLDAPDEGRVNAWAHLSVGPRDGYERLPDRPPKRA